MSTPDPIEDYLKQLRRRLRWRRGGRRMAEEVEDHLRELAGSAEGDGASGEDAARIAIERMGDPTRMVPGHGRTTVIAGVAVALLVSASIGLVAVDRSHPAAAPNAGYRLSPAQARTVARQVALIDQGYTTGYHQVSLAYGVESARFPVYLPDSPMANDGNVQSTWSLYGEGIAVNVVYRSGILVMEQRWQAHTSPSRWLRDRPGRHLRLAGALASVNPSQPPVPTQTYQGFAPPAIVRRYGVAASVYTVRGSTLILLLGWGPHALPRLIRVARTLHPVEAAGLPASASRYISVEPQCLGGSVMPIPRHDAEIINRAPVPVRPDACPVVTPDRPLHHRA